MLVRAVYWFTQAGQRSAARLERPEWLSVAIIIAFGIALRWWSPAMRSDFWYDEVCSYTVAGRSFSNMLHLLSLGADTNPPLYTVALHFWLKLGTSDTHVKALSLLFATASLGVFYLLAKRIAGRDVALFSFSLIASSPSVITYSVEARPYAMFLLLSLLSTYFLLSAIEETVPPKRSRVNRLWLGYSIASILTVYTHWFGLLLLGVHGAALAVYYPISLPATRYYFLCLIAIACCCLPLAPLLLHQIALQNAAGGYGWPGKPSLHSVISLASFLAGGENLLALIVMISVTVCFRQRRRILSATTINRRHIMFLTSYLALPVLAVFTLSNLLVSNTFFVNRYFLPFIISVHILTGLALACLDRRIALAFVLLFALFPVVKAVRHWQAPETPYSQAVSELSSQSRDDVLIAHLSPMSYFPVLHYRRNSTQNERILCVNERGGYETAYNLDGEMLSGDQLIRVGAEVQKYKEMWLIIDSMDKDKTLGIAYEYIRNNNEFVLESEKQIRGLRLEHYTLRAF